MDIINLLFSGSQGFLFIAPSDITRLMILSDGIVLYDYFVRVNRSYECSTPLLLLLDIILLGHCVDLVKEEWLHDKAFSRNIKPSFHLFLGEIGVSLIPAGSIEDEHGCGKDRQTNEYQKIAAVSMACLADMLLVSLCHYENDDKRIVLHAIESYL